jgi:hypothetical protein
MKSVDWFFEQATRQQHDYNPIQNQYKVVQLNSAYRYAKSKVGKDLKLNVCN